MKFNVRNIMAFPVPSITQSVSSQGVLWHQIALEAYLQAEARGFRSGRGLDDRLKAEREPAAGTSHEVPKA
jgi:Protein of unknown function (DUF2934)